MLQGDARISLVPGESTSLYLHRHSSSIHGEGVCGPFACPSNVADASCGRSICRIAIERDVDGFPFVAYERGFDSYTQGIRDSVTATSAASSLRYHALCGEYRSILCSWSTLLSDLFKHTLCSMTRIVLSASIEGVDGWIMVTTRDEEKRHDAVPSVCFVRLNQNGQLECVGLPGALPSSSSTSCLAFHAAFGSGVLCHSHNVFAVLLNRAISGGVVINSHPRTAQFGRELASGLRNHNYVLRPGEGIWTCGRNAEEAVAQTMLVQDRSVAAIRESVRKGLW